LLFWLARIPLRIGSGYRWYSFFFNRRWYEHRKDAAKHEVEYNLNLLRAIDCEIHGDIRFDIIIPAAAHRKAKDIRRRFSVGDGDTVVILHPGSGGSAMDWKPKQFGELGDKLVQELGVKIFVTGNGEEHALVAEVLACIPSNAFGIVGELNLKEFAALIQSAKLFIANSTGPLHIASAVGTPVIGLYPSVAPMHPRRWAPLTEKKIIFMPKSDEETHLLDDTIMNIIRVDEVFQAAQTMLAQHLQHVALTHSS
jgi:heptosyltransferase-2